MIESTKRYIEENERVQLLPKKILFTDKKRDYRIYSFYWLLSKKISLVKEIAKFTLEICVGFRLLMATYRLRYSKNGKKALVLGNGPSQGYLSEIDLERFKKAGGEIFGVNHINENALFSKIPPDYLVLSDSGTLNFSLEHHEFHNKNKALLNYLQKHQNIKIICAVLRIKNLAKLLGKDRIIGAFIDSELIGISENISPIFPRGYCSMTLYKSLAIALWYGYKSIYVLGMDNTYPRNIYSDKDNNILNLEIHSGSSDYVADISQYYGCIGDLLVDLSNIFYDAKKFANKSIINLDPYSLTDAFEKNPTRDISKFIDQL
jgi:hypothetical protein